MLTGGIKIPIYLEIQLKGIPNSEHVTNIKFQCLSVPLSHAYLIHIIRDSYNLCAESQNKALWVEGKHRPRGIRETFNFALHYL